MDISSIGRAPQPVSTATPQAVPTTTTDAPAPPTAGDQATISTGTSPTDSVSHVRLLHMSDIHGAVDATMNPKVDAEHPLGGLAAAKATLDRERASAPGGVLALNAGDLAEGTMVSYLTGGKVVGEALHEFGFDAIEPGNHDFVMGVAHLRELLSQIGAPVVGANIVNGADGTPMAGTSPYLLRDVDGVRLAIVGLDTPDMERFVDRSRLEGLKFRAAADTLQRVLPEVRAQGADVVIVLSHLGFDEDRKLANAVPGLDVIVGGHSHTELPQGHVENGTIIVHPGAQGHFVGKLDLCIDRQTRRITSHEACLVKVSDREVHPDDRVAAIVERYSQEVEAASSQVMGVASEELVYSHKEACKLNQIHADSLLAATGAEIALTSARNLRGNVKPGEVPFKDLFAAFPMTEEDAVVFRVTGGMLRAELEDRIADGGRGIAVPAGLEYSYDPTRPNLDRVTSMTLPDGTPVDMDREYTVATTMTTARKKTFSQARDLKIVDSSQKIFMDYFKSGSPWRNDADSRVRRETA